MKQLGWELLGIVTMTLSAIVTIVFGLVTLAFMIAIGFVFMLLSVATHVVYWLDDPTGKKNENPSPSNGSPYLRHSRERIIDLERNKDHSERAH